MSRILLADDSPHAQRIGETILREEGFEVVTVTDGDAALASLIDVDPDLIVADVLLPLKSGYEICRHVKNHPRFTHTRVVLTAGALEGLDEEEARRAGADAWVRKPFEATAVLATVKPLIDAAGLARAAGFSAGSATGEIDAERVRAAVTVALDAAMPALIDEITEKVLIALNRTTG
jgi:CheY-like chemotaxis protein